MVAAVPPGIGFGDALWQVGVLVLGGGTLRYVAKWRLEAGSTAVQAADDAVALVRSEMAHMRHELQELRTRIIVAENTATEAVAEAARWKEKYIRASSDLKTALLALKRQDKTRQDTGGE